MPLEIFSCNELRNLNVHIFENQLMDKCEKNNFNEFPEL